MDASSLPPHATATIAAMLTDERVDPSYAAFVVRHLDAPDEGWRWCCGSNCDPCVQRLGRVVDRVRTALAIAPGGIPVDGGSA
ncbi:MAG: hypothetical protein JNK78_12220 [Planctomycetes bacterium]|nr:hypothetical protein [Planctomycetota bacterium]